MHAENNSYSIGALNAIGGKIKVIISGGNLKSDAVVHLDGNTGVHAQSQLTPGGFPNTVTLEYGTGGLTPGNYQVSVWRVTAASGNTLYGGLQF